MGESTKAVRIASSRREDERRRCLQRWTCIQGGQLKLTLKGETKDETTARLLIRGTAGLAGQLAPIKLRGLFVSASIPSGPLAVHMRVFVCMYASPWIKSTSITWIIIIVVLIVIIISVFMFVFIFVSILIMFLYFFVSSFRFTFNKLSFFN